MAWTTRPLIVVIPWLVLAAAGVTACEDRYAGAGALEAEKATLQREVEGLRDSTARLFRGDPIFPASDVLVAIDESLVQRLITARLPIDITSAPYTVTLSSVDVGFSGAPTVHLHGTIARDGIVDLQATAGLLGALSDIEIDRASSTLRAAIAVDHFDIERVAGTGSILGGASLDEVSRLLRPSVAEQLPAIEIPIRVSTDLDIPAITTGPFRLDGLRLPLSVTVSRVLADHQRLWVSLHVELGTLGSVRP